MTTQTHEDRGSRDLRDALARVATGHQERAQVWELATPERDATAAAAARWAGLVWNDFRRCVLREIVPSTDLAVAWRFSDGGTLTAFPASGAAEAALTESWREEPIARDERRADRKGLRPVLDRIARSLAESALQSDEELRSESVWEIKGRATTLAGETGPTALLAVVGAWRRWVAGLPVLGRASVTVKLVGAQGARVAGWSVDWRARTARVVATSPVIPPDEAAKRVTDELVRLRAGHHRPASLDDYHPASFQLGYLSAGRRSPQRLLQPAWVAVLEPRGRFTTGRVVAVPAAPVPFGPVVTPAVARRAGG